MRLPYSFFYFFAFSYPELRYLGQHCKKVNFSCEKISHIEKNNYI